MTAPIMTLDTNVVVSALRSSRGASYRLLELLVDRKFEIGVTAALVLEYEEVCRRLVGSTWVTNEDVDAVLDSSAMSAGTLSSRFVFGQRSRTPMTS